jgi:caffeoyl-CoA O-methyltransferase
MKMTEALWDRTSAYLDEVFGREDAHLASLMERAVAAGLPDIAVSAEVGRLLSLLTSMAGGGRGARLALEVGTLGGYSAIWIARALAPGGRLITLEPEDAHASFAERMFEEAGVADRVEVRREAGLEGIPSLREEFGHDCFDLVFLDAIKTEYSGYAREAKPLLTRGGLLLADNVISAGSWHVAEEAGSSEDRNAIDAFNRGIAADPDYEAACVVNREGLLVARRV